MEPSRYHHLNVFRPLLPVFEGSPSMGYAARRVNRETKVIDGSLNMRYLTDSSFFRADSLGSCLLVQCTGVSCSTFYCFVQFLFLGGLASRKGFG